MEFLTLNEVPTTIRRALRNVDQTTFAYVKLKQILDAAKIQYVEKAWTGTIWTHFFLPDRGVACFVRSTNRTREQYARLDKCWGKVGCVVFILRGTSLADLDVKKGAELFKGKLEAYPRLRKPFTVTWTGEVHAPKSGALRHRGNKP